MSAAGSNYVDSKADTPEDKAARLTVSVARSLWPGPQPELQSMVDQFHAARMSPDFKSDPLKFMGLQSAAIKNMLATYRQLLAA